MAGEPAEDPDGATIGSVVRLSISNGLNRLLDHDLRLRLTPENPPVLSVHQARVATRRLRSDLKTFRQLLDPVWLEHTMTELKWLGAVFGRIRDLDVLAERVGSDGGLDQGRHELCTALECQRSEASRQLTIALNDRRYFHLLERLAAAATLPPIEAGKGAEPAVDQLPPLMWHQYKALRRRVRHGGRHPDDARLHRIRIGAKQLRYASEAASPYLGKSAVRSAKAAKHLQTVLGEHHDAVAAEKWFREIAAVGGPTAAFEAGLLTAQARRQRADVEGSWRKAWRDVTHAIGRARS